MTEANTNPRHTAPAAQIVAAPEPDGARPRPQIPTTAFGGYDRASVDALLAGYEERAAGLRRSLAGQIGAADAMRATITQLQTQLDAAVSERDRLRHRAANPLEGVGRAAQEFYNSARAQADELLAKARAQSASIVDGGKAEAKRLIEQARSDAEAIGRDASARLDERSKALDADRAKLEADRTAALKDVEARREEAKREATGRIAAAEARERRAADTADQIRERLRAAIRALDDADAER